MADNYLQSVLGWMQDPQRTQQMQQLGGLLSASIDNLAKSAEETRSLNSAAFGDQNRPLHVTNKEAFNALAQNALEGPASIAPVGMIVGRGIAPAVTARANQMMNSGASEGRILQETGLVKVPTESGNTWGRQISDKNIQIDFDKLAAAPYDKTFFNRNPSLLGDVVSHPELYDIYPELRTMGLVKTSDGNAFYRNNLDGGEIGLPSTEYTSPEFLKKFQNDRRGMALHELQHAVQEIEGWPRGGNSQEFMGNAYKRVKEQADWGMKSLEDATTAFLEKQGLTAPKDFKSFAQSVEYIKKNGPEYLEDVGPESRKRIQAILSSDQGDQFINSFNRFQDSYKKIEDVKRGAGRKYMSLAGEGQSNAVEAQYTAGDFSNKNPVTGYYRYKPEDMIYKYRGNGLLTNGK